MQQYLNPAEVAARFNVTEQTVRRWVKNGQLPGTKIGGTLRIPADFESRLAQASAAKAAQ